LASAEQLVSQGRIEKAKRAASKASSLLSSAKSDLKAAKDNLPLGNLEWIFRMCQSCAFCSACALMSRYGYLPTRDGDLETVHEFFETAEPEVAKQLLPFLSQQKSPKSAIELAEKFLSFAQSTD
jgi:HEPN domain-containing protein